MKSRRPEEERRKKKEETHNKQQTTNNKQEDINASMRQPTVKGKHDGERHNDTPTHQHLVLLRLACMDFNNRV
jgi:hypothetical protein